MRLAPPPLVLLACAALVPCAAAQDAFPTFTEVPGTANPLGALAVEAVGSPVFGDLTGDGVPDLLYDPATITPIARRSGGTDFLFFEGRRDATGRTGYAPAALNPFADLQTDAASEQLQSPALADLDGDGDLDLLAVAVFDLDGRVVYFENVGTASAPAFAYRDDQPASDAAAGFLALADVDGDDDADLVTVLPAEAGAELRYYENTGTPSAAVFSETPSPFGDASFPVLTFAPAFFDGDGDGDLDAAVGGVDLAGDGAALVRLYENVGAAGTPDFALAAEQPFADLAPSPFSDDDSAAPAAADLDGDGDADLAVVLGIGPFPRSVYFENVGAGSFALAPELGNPVRFDALTPDGDGPGIYAAGEAGDLDGDGDLDLVFGTTDAGPLRYAENVGTAEAPAFRYRTGAQNPFAGIPFGEFSSPSLFDLDADGDLDALVSVVLDPDEGPGTFFYLENTGTAAAPAFALVTGGEDPFAGLLSAPLAPAGASFADLDGDGDADLVLGVLDLSTLESTLRYAENVGTTQAPAFSLVAEDAAPLPAVGGTALLGPALADLDGDGDLDLVVSAPDLNSDAGEGPLQVFQNVGTASAAAFRDVSASPGLFGGPAPLPSRPVLGDFDADGDADAFSGVALLDPDDDLSGSRIRFFLNNGDLRVDAAPAPSPLAGLSLGPAFPNPSAGAIQLRLSLGTAQHVRAEAFDALGRRVAVLHDGPLAAGTDHPIRFDASALPAGLYVVRVQADGGAAVRRVTKL